TGGGQGRHRSGSGASPPRPRGDPRRGTGSGPPPPRRLRLSPPGRGGESGILLALHDPRFRSPFGRDGATGPGGDRSMKTRRTFKSIGIVAKPDFPRSRVVLRRLAALLDRHGVPYHCDPETAKLLGQRRKGRTLSVLAGSSPLILVLGGD